MHSGKVFSCAYFYKIHEYLMHFSLTTQCLLHFDCIRMIQIFLHTCLDFLVKYVLAATFDNGRQTVMFFTLSESARFLPYASCTLITYDGTQSIWHSGIVFQLCIHLMLFNFSGCKIPIVHFDCICKIPTQCLLHFDCI